LIAALQSRGWVSSRALCQELHTKPRTVREAAHKSCGEVISGQRGYRLTRESTVEDVSAFSSRMYSQAREMRHRALEVESVGRGVLGHGGVL
jgi:hypothetical protein